eukprot:TRINITY_DN4796_c0_g2_i2.p1 TRINITY_DN4796_c0_g2~~TRINITY_DN4796_c0_g2_i2.p1  ORF type:complete len:200 (-),score=24.44 TRINITY_DN4796_c0_g2_i2:156-755(-)
MCIRDRSKTASPSPPATRHKTQRAFRKIHGGAKRSECKTAVGWKAGSVEEPLCDKGRSLVCSEVSGLRIHSPISALQALRKVKKTSSKERLKKQTLVNSNKCEQVTSAQASPRPKLILASKNLKAVASSKPKTRWYDIRPRLLINHYYRKNFILNFTHKKDSGLTIAEVLKKSLHAKSSSCGPGVMFGRAIFTVRAVEL